MRLSGGVKLDGTRLLGVNQGVGGAGWASRAGKGRVGRGVWSPCTFRAFRVFLTAPTGNELHDE